MVTEITKRENSVWKTLSRINVNEHTESKNGLTYLSWAWAYGIVKDIYPDMSFDVREWDGKPYMYDPVLGYMVETSVNIDGNTVKCRLPVMDFKNRAIKAVPYVVRNKYGKDENVEGATMFDINTAIQRCLAKNIALFGLGHYIYAGEDIPNTSVQDDIMNCKSVDELTKLKPKITNDELTQLAINKYNELTR